jgi:hypothetical protein
VKNSTLDIIARNIDIAVNLDLSSQKEGPGQQLGQSSQKLGTVIVGQGFGHLIDPTTCHGTLTAEESGLQGEKQGDVQKPHAKIKKKHGPDPSAQKVQ